MLKLSEHVSLRILLGVLALLGAVLVGVAGALAAQAVNDVSTQTDQVKNVLQRAANSANDLNLATANMERGLSAFVLGGFESDLRPFLQGKQRSLLELGAMNRLVGSDREIAELLDAVAAARAEWLSVSADPAIAARRAGNVGRARHLVTRARNLLLFGEFLDASDRVRAKVDAARADAVEDLAEQGNRLLRLTAAGVSVLFLAVLVASWLQFRWVVAPLRSLGAQMRRAADERDIPGGITVSGPAEIRAVGRDAEHMRRQLVDQIDRVVRARDSVRRAQQSLARDAPVVTAIQRELTARTDPDLPGVWVHGEIHPAETVLAGDFWDTVAAPDGKAALVITDVAGHGPAVGVAAARLKHLLAVSIASGRSPASALALADRRLQDVNEPIATAAIVVVDPADGTVSWANAGHHPPLILRPDGQVEELGRTGLLLSWLGGPWGVETTRMGPEDVLLLYSDGLVESHDDVGRQLGIPGLVDMVRRTRTSTDTTAQLVRGTLTSARSRAVDWDRDDITLVALTLAARERSDPASGARRGPGSGPIRRIRGVSGVGDDPSQSPSR